MHVRMTLLLTAVLDYKICKMEKSLILKMEISVKVNEYISNN